MGSHSLIAPSSAHRWGSTFGCPGSVAMEQLFPALEETQASAEGTASHNLAEWMIKNDSFDFDRARIIIGTPDPKTGVEITEEMYAGAEEFAKHVRSIVNNRPIRSKPGTNDLPHGTLKIESRVHAKRRIHEQSFGTVDCFYWDPMKLILYVWDYKFGYSIVEAVMNWQIINYTAAILETLGINGLTQQKVTVKTFIVQPRAQHKDGHIRPWTFRASDIRAQVNTLANNAQLALSPNAPTRSGPHCKNCTARTHCQTAIDAGARLFEVCGEPTPLHMSNDAIAVQLDLVTRSEEQAKNLRVGLEELITHRIKKGERFPGYTLTDTVGREAWTVDPGEVVGLGEQFGAELGKLEVVTPNQARKKGVPAEFVAAFSHRPNRGIILVKDDGSKAREVFKK